MHTLIFFGSDRYSALVLAKLLESPDLTLKAVITDSDATPTASLAKQHGLTISHYPDVPKNSGQDTLGLCASFDHLLPEATIGLFGGNLYNLHPSLLPQYRNVSPVQYAIALGDKTTGITLFKISQGIDNGEMVAQITEPITANDTTPELSDRLFSRGAQLFLDHLRAPVSPGVAPTSTSLIFTQRLTRDSGHLEWSLLLKLLKNEQVKSEETSNQLIKLRLLHNPGVGTEMLDDLTRALAPWPGVWSQAETKKGELRLSLESVLPEVTVKLAGKPKAITWSDFEKYYL